MTEQREPYTYNGKIDIDAPAYYAELKQLEADGWGLKKAEQAFCLMYERSLQAYCTYCGAELEREPAEIADHIFTCEKRPEIKLNAVIEDLAKQLDRATLALSEIAGVIDKYNDPADAANAAVMIARTALREQESQPC